MVAIIRTGNEPILGCIYGGPYEKVRSQRHLGPFALVTYEYFTRRRGWWYRQVLWFRGHVILWLGSEYVDH